MIISHVTFPCGTQTSEGGGGEGEGVAAGREATEARGTSQGAGVQAAGAETGATAGEGGGRDAEEDPAGRAAHPHCSPQARDHPAPV